MITIDGDTARLLLHRAVEEKPDGYVDPYVGQGACNYVYYEGDEVIPVPGCLVGTCMVYAGVPLQRLERISSGTVGEVDWEDVSVSLTDEAKDLFTRAQWGQDQGQAWAAAVEFAERATGRLDW